MRAVLDPGEQPPPDRQQPVAECTQPQVLGIDQPADVVPALVQPGAKVVQTGPLPLQPPLQRRRFRRPAPVERRLPSPGRPAPSAAPPPRQDAPFARRGAPSAARFVFSARSGAGPRTPDRRPSPTPDPTLPLRRQPPPPIRASPRACAAGPDVSAGEAARPTRSDASAPGRAPRPDRSLSSARLRWTAWSSPLQVQGPPLPAPPRCAPRVRWSIAASLPAACCSPPPEADDCGPGRARRSHCCPTLFLSKEMFPDGVAG